MPKSPSARQKARTLPARIDRHCLIGVRPHHFTVRDTFRPHLFDVVAAGERVHWRGRERLPFPVQAIALPDPEITSLRRHRLHQRDVRVRVGDPVRIARLEQVRRFFAHDGDGVMEAVRELADIGLGPQQTSIIIGIEQIAFPVVANRPEIQPPFTLRLLDDVGDDGKEGFRGAPGHRIIDILRRRIHRIAALVDEIPGFLRRKIEYLRRGAITRTHRGFVERDDRRGRRVRPFVEARVRESPAARAGGRHEYVVFAVHVDDRRILHAIDRLALHRLRRDQRRARRPVERRLRGRRRRSAAGVRIDAAAPRQRNRDGHPENGFYEFHACPHYCCSRMTTAPPAAASCRARPSRAVTFTARSLTSFGVAPSSQIVAW